MTKQVVATLCVLAWLIATAPPAVADAEVDGVVSLTPVAEHSCIAVELRTDPGAVISGVRWFHNDENVAFPSLLLMEGQGNTPPDVSQVALILDEVTGESLAWGEVMLDEPVTTQSGIVYSIFELPAYDERTGTGSGGGAGIGYVQTDVAAPTFLSNDAVHWVQLDRGLQLQVELVLAGPLRTAAAPMSLMEARGTRPEGWWDNLEAEVAPIPPAAAAEQDVPAIVHSGRRLAAVPNPFNPRTEVHFFLTRAGKVEVDVFDVRGRRVNRLVRGRYPAGAHSIVWNGMDHANQSVASGVYYLRMESPDGVNDLRVTLVR